MAAEELWTSAAALLKTQVSDGVWQSTFAPITPIEVTGERIVLGLPNNITRDKLDRRFRPMVEDAVAEAAGNELAVHFQLVLPTLFDDDLVPANEHEVRTGADMTNGATPSAMARTASPDQSGLGVVHTVPVGPSIMDAEPSEADSRHRYTFDTFVIGPSNRFAHAAALSVAERPGGSYNPLFIYGSAGLGKTHILKAIEHFVSDVYPKLKVQYVSTETFLNEFIDSIKNSSGNDFKRRYRQIDVLLVDDIQFIEGKDSLQEELFHTFNDLYGARTARSFSRPTALRTPSPRWRIG